MIILIWILFSFFLNLLFFLGEVSTICELHRPAFVVIAANKSILVTSQQNKVFKVTQGIFLPLHPPHFSPSSLPLLPTFAHTPRRFRNLWGGVHSRIRAFKKDRGKTKWSKSVSAKWNYSSRSFSYLLCYRIWNSHCKTNFIFNKLNLKKSNVQDK